MGNNEKDQAAAPPLQLSSDASPEAQPDSQAALAPGGELLEGRRLWCQQFTARIWKRSLAARRDRRAVASQLLLPVSFVLLALVLARLLEKTLDLPPLKLSTDMYDVALEDQHIMPLSVEKNSQMAAKLGQAFQDTVGPGDKVVTVQVEASRDGVEEMTGYLLDASRELRGRSFGAMSVNAAGDDGANVTLWFDNRARHGIPAMMNLCNNARARFLGFEDTQTQAWNHPLPKTRALIEQETTGSRQVMRDLLVAITMILAMGFIPASFVVYLVHERATNGKHQQFLTGVSPTMYWLTTYCWDMISFLIPLVCSFAMFLAFQLQAYSGENSFAIIVLLLTYGACMTPCMYCLEPLFAVPSTAYVTMICTNIFTGTVSVLGTVVMDLTAAEGDFPKLIAINDVCKQIFPWLLPNYNLGRGMLNLATNHYMNLASDTLQLSMRKDPLHMDVAGWHILCLVLMCGVWFVLRLLIEWRLIARALSRSSASPAADAAGARDAAVIAEASRAASVHDRLVITKLTKSFIKRGAFCCRQKGKTVHSVRGISVGVAGGECFGLLGVNGAGKTTTMRMITGDIEPDRGDVSIGGHSVRTARDRARRLLGYCPQFDALPDRLTVRETLTFYARIRGVDAMRVGMSVDGMIERMCLEAHQHRQCHHLSGGNRRKLSTALALIGEPAVVLLDEPSTGIDVGARRFLWEVLGDLRRRGHALVLTSHSMDECEVLCTRLTIMVHGQFRCLGTPLQLKDRFGGGYTLTVKACSQRDGSAASEDGSADPKSMLRSFVAATIPTAVLCEENVGLFRYRFGGGQLGGRPEDVRLADIFRAFEEAKTHGGALHGCISDYNVSQTSLEEVFLHFTREAEAGSGHDGGDAPAPPAALSPQPPPPLIAGAAGAASQLAAEDAGGSSVRAPVALPSI
eukprot:TRINITY_DN4541_c0_g1_i1.p1 TRINITY_DN4541_c0_g1~~TRINITY_DN4541_c0_g1_i1.p1  ORF type:complete len:913 (-),score=175.97 TRINITY_DN4541_c0_g1_i1:308-3046(-)